MAKILLVDDDPDVCMMMSLVLRKEGHQVRTASSRQEALQQLAQETPSLILLDVLLSGSDGRELCREIKAREQTRNIPVIMLSGHPSAGLQLESWGADDFIAKPFNTKQLLEKLSQRVGRNSGLGMSDVGESL